MCESRCEIIVNLGKAGTFLETTRRWHVVLRFGITHYDLYGGEIEWRGIRCVEVNQPSD